MTRSKEGALKFSVILDGELAKLFETEVEMTDRNRASLVRVILKDYFKDKVLRKEYEQFRQFQSVPMQAPHFGESSPRSRRTGAA